jgi:speckle-type POZ protein
LTDEGADVMFEVGGGGDKFMAHRCVLAARSGVFKALLVGDKNNRPTAPGSIVKIDDIEAKVFRGLLAFIYTDAFPDWNMGNLEKDRAAEGETESGEDEEKYLMNM